MYSTPCSTTKHIQVEACWRRKRSLWYSTSYAQNPSLHTKLGVFVISMIMPLWILDNIYTWKNMLVTMEVCFLPFSVIFHCCDISNMPQEYLKRTGAFCIVCAVSLFMFLWSILLHHKKYNPKIWIVPACFCPSYCCDCVVSLNKTAAVKPSVYLILSLGEPFLAAPLSPSRS